MAAQSSGSILGANDVFCADNASQTTIRSQSFDRDPGWDAKNNRIVPKEYPTIEQNFGYSKTSFASRSPGEMGGLISRAWEPAYYGLKIGPKTLDDKFSAGHVTRLCANVECGAPLPPFAP